MSRILSLDELSKMFAENYAVVSLKFVRSHLLHSKQSEKNAKALLEKAGFTRGPQVDLPDSGNASKHTNGICYWNFNYFYGVKPDKHTMQKLANKKVSGKAKPAAAATPEPVADQQEEKSLTLGFNAEKIQELMQDLFEKTIKNYLRSLPADHQQALGHIFKSIHTDVGGCCVLIDEDGTRHELSAYPLPEDARRFYTPLINMFYNYNGKEFWGPYILWLEQHGKEPTRWDAWKGMFKPPYSEALLSSYFFLNALGDLYSEELLSVKRSQAIGLC
ncbi:TPA: hypothetical protein KL481_004517 [Escherichia coli]|nr:hypothetical protein [Escherichia coli]